MEVVFKHKKAEEWNIKNNICEVITGTNKLINSSWPKMELLKSIKSTLIKDFDFALVIKEIQDISGCQMCY